MESRFQAELIRELKEMFPGCIVLKNDPSYIQGIPDLIVLYNSQWAALECKAGPRSAYQPNQEYYVNMLDDMSFAAFIHPQNKVAILDELQYAFRTGRKARLSKR